MAMYAPTEKYSKLSNLKTVTLPWKSVMHIVAITARYIMAVVFFLSNLYITGVSSENIIKSLKNHNGILAGVLLPLGINDQ